MLSESRRQHDHQHIAGRASRRRAHRPPKIVEARRRIVSGQIARQARNAADAIRSENGFCRRRRRQRRTPAVALSAAPRRAYRPPTNRFGTPNKSLRHADVPTVPCLDGPLKRGYRSRRGPSCGDAGRAICPLTYGGVPQRFSAGETPTSARRFTRDGPASARRARLVEKNPVVANVCRTQPKPRAGRRGSDGRDSPKKTLSTRRDQDADKSGGRRLCRQRAARRRLATFARCCWGTAVAAGDRPICSSRRPRFRSELPAIAPRAIAASSHAGPMRD